MLVQGSRVYAGSYNTARWISRVGLEVSGLLREQIQPRDDVGSATTNPRRMPGERILENVEMIDTFALGSSYRDALVHRRNGRNP